MFLHSPILLISIQNQNSGNKNNLGTVMWEQMMEKMYESTRQSQIITARAWDKTVTSMYRPRADYLSKRGPLHLGHFQSEARNPFSHHCITFNSDTEHKTHLIPTFDHVLIMFIKMQLQKKIHYKPFKCSHFLIVEHQQQWNLSNWI